MPDAGHEDSHNTGDVALFSTVGWLGLSRKNGHSTRQQQVASRSGNYYYIIDKNPRHTNMIIGWEVQSFTAPDPVNVMKQILLKVSERFTETYKDYINQYNLESELIKEL
jgi:hypothetical protein